MLSWVDNIQLVFLDENISAYRFFPPPSTLSRSCKPQIKIRCVSSSTTGSALYVLWAPNGIFAGFRRQLTFSASWRRVYPKMKLCDFYFPDLQSLSLHIVISEITTQSESQRKLVNFFFAQSFDSTIRLFFFRQNELCKKTQLIGRIWQKLHWIASLGWWAVKFIGFLDLFVTYFARFLIKNTIGQISRCEIIIQDTNIWALNCAATEKFELGAKDR